MFMMDWKRHLGLLYGYGYKYIHIYKNEEKTPYFYFECLNRNVQPVLKEFFHSVLSLQGLAALHF